MAPDDRLHVRVMAGEGPRERAHVGRTGRVERMLGQGYCSVQLDGREYYTVLKVDNLESI